MEKKPKALFKLRVIEVTWGIALWNSCLILEL